MKRLTEGEELRLILGFATPMLIGYLFEQAYQLGDTFVLGRLIGKEAMSASGAVFPLIFLILSFITGFSSAATILVSQKFGANKTDQVGQIFTTLMVISLVGGIGIMLFGLAVQYPVFRLMGLGSDVFPLAVRYFSVLMTGSVYILGFNSIAAVFRGLGNSKTPVFLTIISDLVNLALDFLFVAGFGFGVGSVALATVLAYLFSLIVGIVLIRNKFRKYGIRIKTFEFSKQHFKELLKLGVPNSFQMSFVAIAFFFIYTFVNAFGTDVLAAFAAVGRINSLAISPAFIFATAVTAFTGQNFGAKQCVRIKRALRKTLLASGTIALVLSVVIYTSAEFLVNLFTVDSNVIQIGTSYLVTVSPFYLFFYFSRVILGVVKGLGDTVKPMRITWVSTFGVRLPVSFFFAFRLQLRPLKIFPSNYKGIWWGEPFAWIFGFILSLIVYFKKYKKRLTKCLF